MCEGWGIGGGGLSDYIRVCVYSYLTIQSIILFVLIDDRKIPILLTLFRIGKDNLLQPCLVSYIVSRRQYLEQVFRRVYRGDSRCDRRTSGR